MEELRIYTGGFPRYFLYFNGLVTMALGFYLFGCDNLSGLCVFGFLLSLSCLLLSIKYILSNSIVMDKHTIRCFYTGYCGIFQVLSPSFSVIREYPLERLSYVSLNSLRSIPKKLDILKIRDLRRLLFPLKGGSQLLAECSPFGSGYSIIFVFDDGRSKLFYTEPFDSKSLFKLYQRLQDRGVQVIS